MNPKILHAIGLVLAIASGILATADQLVAIAALNPMLSHSWPIVLASATAIDRLGKLFLPKPTQPLAPIGTILEKV